MIQPSLFDAPSDTMSPAAIDEHRLASREARGRVATPRAIDPSAPPRFVGDLKSPPFDGELKPVGHSDWRELSAEEIEAWRKAEQKLSGFSKLDVVVHGGRELRFHRDCGEHVWLAALDAGIAGPFYWVRKAEIDLSGLKVDDGLFQPSGSSAERAARLKAAQLRLGSVSKEQGLNGPEYMAALGELRAAMREGVHV